MSNSKLFSIKQGNDFRIEVSKITDINEIKGIVDELTSASKNYSIPVKEISSKGLKTLLKFLAKVENVPFNLTAPFVATFDEISRLINEPAKDDVLKYDVIKVVQTVLVGSTWSAKPTLTDPVKEGRNLLDALKSLEAANIELAGIEQKIQIASAREAQIEQEIQTGLQTKAAEEDDTTKLVVAASDEQ